MSGGHAEKPGPAHSPPVLLSDSAHSASSQANTVTATAEESGVTAANPLALSHLFQGGERKRLKAGTWGPIAWGTTQEPCDLEQCHFSSQDLSVLFCKMGPPPFFFTELTDLGVS